MSPTPISVSDSDILFLTNTNHSSSLVRLHKGEFKHVTECTAPWRTLITHVRTCAGVVLLTHQPDSFTLWSPSTDASSVVRFSYSFRDPKREAICYDPVTDDVKVVLVAWGHYMVYSSNNKSWTNNGKRAPYCFLENVDKTWPVTVEGAVYWAENRSREIVRFDPTRNEFEEVRILPEGVEGEFSLVCLGGRLCLWSWLGGTERVGVRFWVKGIKGKGKDVNSWEELMRIENREMMSRARKRFEPLCVVRGDEILIGLDGGVNAVYSPRKDTFEAISDVRDGLVPFAVKALVPNVQSDDQLVRIQKNNYIWRLEKYLEANED